VYVTAALTKYCFIYEHSSVGKFLSEVSSLRKTHVGRFAPFRDTEKSQMARRVSKYRIFNQDVHFVTGLVLGENKTKS
jgi:hypothetical protein